MGMQLSDRDLLTVAQSIIESQGKTIKRVDDLEVKFDKLVATVDAEVYLTMPQAVAMKKAVSARVRGVLPGKEEYAASSKAVYSALWRSLKEVYQVTSYREVPRFQFENAMKYIREWQPLVLIGKGA